MKLEAGRLMKSVILVRPLKIDKSQKVLQYSHTRKAYMEETKKYPKRVYKIRRNNILMVKLRQLKRDVFPSGCSFLAWFARRRYKR